MIEQHEESQDLRGCQIPPSNSIQQAEDEG